MRIRESETFTRISGGGVVFTQTLEQCSVYGKHVRSGVIRFLLFPLWFLMFFGCISWLCMIILGGEDEDFVPMLITTIITGTMIVPMLHILLWVKPFFTLDRNGLRFYWRICCCRIPWRYVPLDGVLEIVSEGNQPYSSMARLVIFTDRQVFYFGKTSQIPVIAEITSRLQQRLSNLRMESQVVDEPLLFDGSLIRVGISLTSPSREIVPMDEASWAFDSEEGYFYRCKSQELRDAMIRWRTLPFWFYLSGMNFGFLIELVFGTFARLRRYFFGNEQWQLEADRICHAGRGIDEEFPFEDITAALITLNITNQGAIEIQNWHSLWCEDWSILFYDSNRNFLFVIENLKYGDARWMVEQIKRYYTQAV